MGALAEPQQAQTFSASLRSITSGRVLEAMTRAGLRRGQAVEDHGQLRRRDRDAGVLRAREGEGAAFEPPEVEGEPVAHPGQDLQLVPTPVLEDVRVAGHGV